MPMNDANGRHAALRLAAGTVATIAAGIGAMRGAAARTPVAAGRSCRRLALLVLASLGGAPGAGATDARSTAPGVTLTLVVHAVPATAPLHWALYPSAGTLPGVLASGRPFRQGIVDSAGDPTRIELGPVPAGEYFAIVAQDTNGDGDIGTFSDPRGYSGYAGCLVPDWHAGMQPVHGSTAAIAVTLHCNRHRDTAASAQTRAAN